MRLVIAGAGFAGMYAALSAARLRDIEGVDPEELEIALVSPEPTLVIRPRLYEPNPETLGAPLREVLDAVNVVYVQGTVDSIDTTGRSVGIVNAKGERKSLALSPPGDRHRQPPVPAEHSGPCRS